MHIYTAQEPIFVKIMYMYMYIHFFSTIVHYCCDPSPHQWEAGGPLLQLSQAVSSLQAHL